LQGGGLQKKNNNDYDINNVTQGNTMNTKIYTINPDGTVTFNDSIETGNSSSSSLSKEQLERIGGYDDHKLFK